jgi:hypothetical protein
MSVTAITSYSSPSMVEAGTTTPAITSEESGEELQMSDLIEQGLASPIYGCTTSQEILDRLSGKSPYVDAGSTEESSSAAASTVQAGFQTLY